MEHSDPTAGPPAPPVATDLLSRVVHSTDNSIYQLLPAAVATPASAAEVSALLADNERRRSPRPIVARGGATGTNGQSLTDGLVLDLKRCMQRVHDIDIDARIAVVDPGVVAAELDRRLAGDGLVWPPHTSTMNRATVGGMVSTDAAGKGSLVFGRAHRHVAALDLCLADGTSVYLEPTSIADARRIVDDPSERPEVRRLWRELLDIAHDDTVSGPASTGTAGGDIDGGPPDPTRLARAATGYGLERLRTGDVIDPTQLVVGAEGTLGVVTRLWLRLSERPTIVSTVVAVFDTFAAALGASIELTNTGPAAIETFDEVTLRAARSSPAWPRLGADVHEAVGDLDGAVLVIEHAVSSERGDEFDVDSLLATVASSGCRAAVRADDPDVRRAIWKVRADAVGLLARIEVGAPEASARPTAMVEDCAVPIASMPAFVAEFRRLLDDAGLVYGMFGHADVGCVHVRPALDATDHDHERLVGELTGRVVALVAQHGGVLWGEHGRGFRSGVVDHFLGADEVAAMRRIKRAFDPNDRCNPGVLYRPAPADGAPDQHPPLPDVTAPPMRGRLSRRVPVEVRRRHASAFACNGNGLCHDHDESSPMCPSYKATGDPALSPKGRADLIRAWLALAPPDPSTAETANDATLTFGSLPGAAPMPEPSSDERAEFEAALATNLHQCLSCAACAGQCPVEVDIPELKSRFLDAYHERHGRPLADHVLARFETLAPVATRFGPLGRPLTRLAGRLLGLVDLPAPPRRPARLDGLPRFHPDRSVGTRDAVGPAVGRALDAVILPDVFTAILEPDTVVAAYDAIVSTGRSVAIAPLVQSGKFDHVKGRRRAFADAVARQRSLVESVLAVGARPVVIEPAVALLHAHEYRHVDPTHPADDVWTLATFLDIVDATNDGTATGSAVDTTTTGRDVVVLGHCTERARTPTELDRWRRLLEAAGHSVRIVDVGCCGMAGVFGHERANQTMSHDLWRLSWDEAIDDARTTGAVVVATGYSCRSQARRIAGVPLHHPLDLLS
ncbi:MAG: FAD-binding and (Fe-S)-binding domain-containing protein [Actinomycetota bacterium]